MIHKTDFHTRAKQYGHSLEALAAGMTITTTKVVQNVEELKELFQTYAGADDPEMGELLFGNLPNDDLSHGTTAQSLLRRVSEYVYGRAPLSEADGKLIQKAFPLEVDFTSAENYTPEAPVLIHSPTKSQIYNYLTLTLNQGIYFTVYETIVTFNIENVIRNGNSGNPGLADFNIFGATGAAGTTGETGSTGTTGADGGGGTCSSPGVSGARGGNGGTGNTGGTGGPGGPGLPGLASQQATIVINQKITGNLYFFTRSGTGGAGGIGGVGGRGGTGGKGGNGATCGCEHTDGGNAGNGGTGGTGGTGGNGNSGVNAAANVVVKFSSAYQSQMFQNSLPAPFGAFGPAGPKGTGGPKGSVGKGGGASGCPTGNDGSAGSDGGDGSLGTNGNYGTTQGISATIQWKMF